MKFYLKHKTGRPELMSMTGKDYKGAGIYKISGFAGNDDFYVRAGSEYGCYVTPLSEIPEKKRSKLSYKGKLS